MTDLPRRTALKSLAGAGALLAFGGVGTAAARQGARPGPSIVDVAVDNDDFETLVAALDAAGLVSTLDDDGQFTVFAPTDAAFAELGLTPENVGDAFDPAVLTDILLYHVTAGRRYSQSVVRAPEIEMLNGETVAVDGTTLNDGQAEVVATDIEASNGVIHVIDGVLLP